MCVKGFSRELQTQKDHVPRQLANDRIALASSGSCSCCAGSEVEPKPPRCLGLTLPRYVSMPRRSKSNTKVNIAAVIRLSRTVGKVRRQHRCGPVPCAMSVARRSAVSKTHDIARYHLQPRVCGKRALAAIED